MERGGINSSPFLSMIEIFNELVSLLNGNVAQAIIRDMRYFISNEISPSDKINTYLAFEIGKVVASKNWPDLLLANALYALFLAKDAHNKGSKESEINFLLQTAALYIKTYRNNSIINLNYCCV